MQEPNGLFGALADALDNDWQVISRLEQRAPPGDWTTWVFNAGRGAGKTRSGSQWIQGRVESGVARRIHLIAPTAADVRDVLLEGPAGILSIASPHMRPVYSPTLRKVTWPNGAQALLFSGEEADRLRGPQGDTIWIDELCAMRQAQEVLDMAVMGLRLGRDPKMLVTTTPRPIKAFKQLLAREGADVVVTRSTTMANAANLAKPFLDQIISRYEGTRLGRQEINAELLQDAEGALWQLMKIEELRVRTAPEAFERVVVAVDPAVSFGEDSDETGIVVVGLAPNGQAYVIEDVSGKYPPAEWAQRAILAYRIHRADRIIGEVNNGGALVEHTLRSVDPGIPFKAVHASRGKMARAEPVSALYERGRVHHVGNFAKLEDQMCSFDGTRSGDSPDRLDALVWGITELMLDEPPGGFLKEAALLPRAPDGSPGLPIEMPTVVDMVFASAAAAVGPESDVIGVVYFAASPAIDDNPPLIILDWSIQQIDGATFSNWLPTIFKRMDALRGECRARFQRSALLVEASGVGEVLWQQGQLQNLSVQFIANERLAGQTFNERAVMASGYANMGKVRIARPAHDKTESVKGVNRNHLLAQITAFGIGQDEGLAGVLLAAFANGVVDTFNSRQMRARVTVR